MSLTARPDCDHCQRQARDAAEQDRQRHLALVDAYFAEPIALVDRAERAAAQRVGSKERVL